ncbi:hypothetical protein CB1_000844019 [Camelus ferus]|nr:hypothetical protein CB1_000844019 [Camelus ferus]
MRPLAAQQPAIALKTKTEWLGPVGWFDLPSKKTGLLLSAKLVNEEQEPMCPAPLFNLPPSVQDRVSGHKKGRSQEARAGNEGSSAGTVAEHTYRPEQTEPKEKARS